MATELVLFDKELEELVLVSLLKSPDNIRDYLLGATKEEFFYTPWWKEIFHRMKNLVKEKSTIPNEVDILHDPVLVDSVKTALRASNVFQTSNYIKDIERCKSAIEQLSRAAKERKLHAVHTQLGEYLTKGTRDLKKIVHTLSNRLYEINTDSENFEDSIVRVTDEKESKKLIDSILDNRNTQYIPTGFKQFDGPNTGLPRGGFSLVLGTTGGGKSMVILNMLKAQALAGYKVCLVSLEMNEFELMERRFCSVTGVTLSQLKGSSLTLQERERAMQKYVEYTTKVTQAGGLEDYKCKMNNLNIEELLYGLKPFAYDVIAIDYLGLLKGVDGDDQWRKLSEAARFCKVFAEENNMNVIALAQLGNDGEIRYSKGVLEHANNSFSWIFGKKELETGIIEVQQKKARMSQRFNFYLKMDFTTMTCTDLDSRDREAYIQSNASNIPKKNGNFVSQKTSFFGD